MRVLVTGVAGRLGSSVAHHLVRAGHNVRGMARAKGRRPHRMISRDIEVVDAALTDTNSLGRAAAGMDAVVHLAGATHVGTMSPEKFFDINVTGTLRLLEAASQAAYPVQRFVLVSAAHVYGLSTPHTRSLTEESPVMSGDYYGTSKILAEQLVQRAHQLYGLEFTILRLGWVLAPNEATMCFRLNWLRRFLSTHAAAGRRSNLWPLFAGQDHIAGQFDAAVGSRSDNPAMVVTGPGGQPWALHVTDVRDAAAGITLAIDHKAAADEFFNIAGPRTFTFNEGAAVLARHCDTSTIPVRMPVSLLFELSTAKAENLLGFKPVFDFDAMVSSAFDWEDNPFALDYVPVGEP